MGNFFLKVLREPLGKLQYRWSLVPPWWASESPQMKLNCKFFVSLCSFSKNFFSHNVNLILKRFYIYIWITGEQFIIKRGTWNIIQILLLMVFLGKITCLSTICLLIYNPCLSYKKSVIFFWEFLLAVWSKSPSLIGLQTGTRTAMWAIGRDAKIKPKAFKKWQQKFFPNKTHIPLLSILQSDFVGKKKQKKIPMARAGDTFEEQTFFQGSPGGGGKSQGRAFLACCEFSFLFGRK